jgi:hypothetical protein
VQVEADHRPVRRLRNIETCVTVMMNVHRRVLQRLPCSLHEHYFHCRLPAAEPGADMEERGMRCIPTADGRVRLPTTCGGKHLLRASFDQPDTFPFFEAVSGRNQSETWAGCIVSFTTLTRSSLKASRSVSSRSLAEKAPRVFLASYVLR